MLPELNEAFNKFCQNPTYENQQEIKLYLCKAIGYTEHEAFADEMFKEIVEECKNVTYDMSFEEAVETVLASKEDKK